jgi:hypothetical protein
MAICRTCSTDGISTPCDGAVITIYDATTREFFEVIPIIQASSDGTTYYYRFTYRTTEGEFNYTIYSRDSGVNWIFIQDSNQIAGATAIIPAGGSCPPEGVWTPTGDLKLWVTEIENQLIPTESLDPALTCISSANVPSTANTLDYDTVLANFTSCFNTKVTTYYNKISGGVPCDNLELTKMQLILNLLDKKDCDSNALECLYNRTPLPGVQFQAIETLPYITTVFATPYDYSKVETTGDFREYKGYTVTVTRATGQDVSHTIVDVEYVAGTNISTFTISPAGEAPAYSALVAELSAPTYTSTTYLETFLNFANKYCADCIVTPDTISLTGGGTKGKAPVSADLDPTADYLTKEGTATANVLIYLESEFPINLI